MEWKEEFRTFPAPSDGDKRQAGEDYEKQSERG